MGCRDRWAWNLWVALTLCVGVAAPAIRPLLAQNSGEAAAVPTLHVFANLVQIPVLVLNAASEPVLGISPQRFYVSLDGGPRFRVTHVRRQGDDALALAIVLDLSQPFPSVAQKMDVAMAGLSPQYLHPNDRVSIYAMDCKLVRTAHAAAAVDGELLQRATALALEQWRAQGRMRWTKKCTQPTNLWDSLQLAIADLATQPGRRAMLVVSDGVDRGSKEGWNALRLYAQTSGVAVFGLDGFAVGHFASDFRISETEFRAVCAMSGGEVVSSDPKDVAKKLQWFLTLLRDRYIVEFPHATDTQGGYHDMQISIAGSDADIFSAGASMPVDNAEALKDPTRIQSDPANAPVLGKRKMIAPQ